MASCVVVVEPPEIEAATRDLVADGARSVDCHELNDAAVLTGWFADGLAAASAARQRRAAGSAATVGPGSPSARPAWDAHTAPVEFAPGRVTCFPWSVFDRKAFAEVVEIDPGAGFGAGRHPTTRLVLAALPLDLDGLQVLDVGCGSGVLTVAAAARGASVTAIDIAPAAITATRANAERNRVATRVRASTTPLQALAGAHDLVLANIHAHVLSALAPDMHRVAATGASLSISGFSPAQVSRLIPAIAWNGEPERTDLDGWTALTWH